MENVIVKDESEWLELRKTCVTASETAVLLGLNPYSSPAKLKNPEPFDGNSFTKVGQMLESTVVNITNNVLGTKFKLYEEVYDGKVFFTQNMLGATPDALDGNVLLECKTTRPHTYHKYVGFPPLTYLIQLQTQLYCTGNTEGYLAILNTDLTQQTYTLKWPIVIYKVRRSDELCAIMDKEATRFKTSPTFRVSSKYKKLAKLLLSLCFHRVF